MFQSSLVPSSMYLDSIRKGSAASVEDSMVTGFCLSCRIQRAERSKTQPNLPEIKEELRLAISIASEPDYRSDTVSMRPEMTQNGR